MNTNVLFDFTVNKENKTIVVKREFTADLELVWNAWTKAELLEQWWAPKPYYVETISMNFTKGGLWHYAMVSPEGKKHFCKAKYQDIETQKMFSYKDTFCDENGDELSSMPSTHWNNNFNPQNENSTIVNCVLTYDSEETIENIIKMGFKEGFTMAVQNLDELITQLKKA